ncbi:C-type lectin mosGCTL-1-like [Glandiceps talaboti]
MYKDCNMFYKITFFIVWAAVVNLGSTEECPDQLYCSCVRYEIFCDQKKPKDGRTYQQAAEDFCVEIGGTLANLKTNASNIAVVDMILANGLYNETCIAKSGFWIGLNDIAEEGVYVWGDGEPLGDCDNPYTNWAEGEPDNNTKKDSDGQDCGQLWFKEGRHGGIVGQWDDEYCSKRIKGVICEIQNTCCCQ